MSSEQQTPESTSDFPGHSFREAREALGASLDQLSRELRLPVQTLQKIEAGQFDGLGGPVFVRGYLRAYARRLKLEADEFISAFDRAQGGGSKAVPLRTVGSVSTSPARQSRSVMRFGTFVFVVAIIGVVVWWWKTQYSIDGLLPPKDSAPVTVDTADGNTLVLPTIDDSADTVSAAAVATGASAAVPSVTATSQAAVSGVAAAPESATTGSEPTASAAVAQDVSTATDAAPAAPAVAATAAAGFDPNKPLHISLSANSWLSVKDAAGSSVYSGIAKAGTELDLGGKAPLSVVIGRADAVRSIEYAGKSVDIADVSSKNVARLKLP